MSTSRNFLFVFLLVACTGFMYAQTTGKISGKILDKKTKEPLIGANILLEGTVMGGATNIDGDYFVINVPPGKYNLRITMVGYSPAVYKDAVVSVNRTTTVNAELEEENYQLDEVVVTVKAVNEKKDQTSSLNNISADQIKSLPVENIGDIVSLQAGVVNGHFRGGRTTEVSYLVDGMNISDSYSREGYTVDIENEAVQDMEVITGTFNAEYGRAMSGIVNMVTKEGSDKFHMSASSSFSNYFTSHDDVFIGLKSGDVTRNQDYKFQVEGPIYKNYITFFANARYENSDGYLNGIRRFNINDYTNFTNSNVLKGVSTSWDVPYGDDIYYSEHTGNNDYVAMRWNKNYSLIGKITFRPINDLKFSFMYTKNYKEQQKYGGDDYIYKYKPDGRKTYYDDGDFYLFQMTHVLSTSMFQDFKVSYKTIMYEDYLYKDPFDPRYIADNYSRRAAGNFLTGGQDKGYNGLELNDLNLKYDLTWQLDVHHSIKTGIDYTKHDLTKTTVVVRDVKTGTSDMDDFFYDATANRMVFNPYEPEILSNVYNSDNYNKKPYEYSVYIQDKMEYEDLVMNFGLRYDYFNSNTVYPSQLRNPANQDSYPNNPERMSSYPETKAQKQLSPRFGLSYTLGESAVLHFSYGHFFQMPPLYALYENSRFMIPSSDYSVVIGNGNLKPEKTVQYEMGIWQEIQKGMGIEVSVFYRDIYDLQTAIIISTYNNTKYGYYSNKDYGNVKGLELKLDYSAGAFSFFGNYTLQFTRGIADNPKSAYNTAATTGETEGITRLVPLEWDQRHTLNLSAGYSQENYDISLVGTFNSGIAYTFDPIDDSPLSKQKLYPNNQYRPATFDLSLKANYDIALMEAVKVRLFLSVYNLLDRLNEERVDAATGRAYTTILTQSQISTFKSNFNDIYDASHDPSMYSAPREVKFGVGIIF